MHRRALEFFGGVPRRILYDNLKSVVLHYVGETLHVLRALGLEHAAAELDTAAQKAIARSDRR